MTPAWNRCSYQINIKFINIQFMNTNSESILRPTAISQSCFSSSFHNQVHFIRPLMKWVRWGMDSRKNWKFPAPIRAGFRVFLKRRRKRETHGEEREKRRCVNLPSYHNSSVRRYLHVKDSIHRLMESNSFPFFYDHQLEIFIVLNNELECLLSCSYHSNSFINLSTSCCYFWLNFNQFLFRWLIRFHLILISSPS